MTTVYLVNKLGTRGCVTIDVEIDEFGVAYGPEWWQRYSPGEYVLTEADAAEKFAQFCAKQVRAAERSIAKWSKATLTVKPL